MKDETANMLDDKMSDWNGTPRKLWEAVMAGIEDQSSKELFKMYYSSLELVEYDDATMTVSSPVSTRGWCVRSLTGDMQRLLKRELGREVSVWFVEQVKTEAQMKLFKLPERASVVAEDEIPY